MADLDDETGAMVRKMMFDTQQKQAGKPTSDELNKLSMLDKCGVGKVCSLTHGHSHLCMHAYPRCRFKKAHPEMDFSNVKMQ